MSNTTPKLEPCPFCGGSAKISCKEFKTLGTDENGCKIIKTGFYGRCNMCHSTGKIIYVNIHRGNNTDCSEIITSGIQQAITAWNSRIEKGDK